MKLANTLLFSILLMLIIAMALCSCGDSKAQQFTRDSTFTTDGVARAIILENNTVTYCIVDKLYKYTLKPGDTVWLDVKTHFINDTSNTAMRAVLYKSY